MTKNSKVLIPPSEATITMILSNLEQSCSLWMFQSSSFVSPLLSLHVAEKSNKRPLENGNGNFLRQNTFMLRQHVDIGSLWISDRVNGIEVHFLTDEEFISLLKCLWYGVKKGGHSSEISLHLFWLNKTLPRHKHILRAVRCQTTHNKQIS